MVSVFKPSSSKHLSFSDVLQRPALEKRAGRFPDISSVSVLHGTMGFILRLLTKTGLEEGSRTERMLENHFLRPCCLIIEQFVESKLETSPNYEVFH